ncbi:hypothetical protein GCM10009623_03460 [Nocardioides aestuarii]|uniref:Uncharacterized protein n=1 Tax=Nocardioides aestuarii TaxID=252231 RepID=A0ABW4TIK4_9ACTN
MPEQRGAEWRTALRALGSPLAAFCLVLLVLNDHLLKQAWPGWVTGKLSDLVGLVVAPLLLGVALAALGVRRWRRWSVGPVVTGFVVTKTSVAGAAAVSAAWSLSGVPTHIRADATDLVALPAVLLAMLLWREAGGADGRRRTAAVLGAALLPLGVLATAATGACDTDDGLTSADVVTGRLSGGDGTRRTILVLQDHHDLRAIDAEGEVSTLPRDERERMGDLDLTDGAGCLPDALTCWRVVVGNDAVESSTDGGRSWDPELGFSAEQQEEALDGVAETCGEEPRGWLGDLAVMATPDGPLVTVTAFHAGVWLRDTTGEWRRLDLDELRAQPAPEGVEPAPGWLRSVPPVVPPYAPPGEPTPVPATPGPPTCPPRERTTITPHPANGDPFEVCG